MYLISRSTLSKLEAVRVDGADHPLGEVRDLRGDADFARLVPQQAELSVSWVRLGPGQRLEPHRHPTLSAIIVAEGTGRTLGDLERRLTAGDTVLVPAGALHGFVGDGPAGFWALSLQFEGRALYADPDRPRTVFASSERVGSAAVVELLLNEQARHQARYRNNPLVHLVQSPHAGDPAVRGRLLSHLAVWSNAFQRVLFARAAHQTDAACQDLAEHHLASEIGHNWRLAADAQPAPWDPLLAAACSWFVDRVETASSVEQVVLVHFALEGSGEIFHREAAQRYPDSPHFTIHAAEDGDHFAMGLGVLRQRPDLRFEPLRRTLAEGWDMMELLSRRIAELALGPGAGDVTAVGA
jgi:quercetin dioxygenase-like cupin family protein